MSEPEGHDAFLDRLNRGDLMEATDSMPDRYRQEVRRILRIHQATLVVLAAQEREWVIKAPRLQDKLELMSEIQKAMGHASLLNVLLQELPAHTLDFPIRYPEVLDVPLKHWEDVVLRHWLLAGGSLIVHGLALSGSYAPYARALKRMVDEERLSFLLAQNWLLNYHAPRAPERFAHAFNRLWFPMLRFFGPPLLPGLITHQSWALTYHLRAKSNEALRQKFLAKFVPLSRELGFAIPDETLLYDAGTRQWQYRSLDWTHHPGSRRHLGRSDLGLPKDVEALKEVAVHEFRG